MNAEAAHLTQQAARHADAPQRVAARSLATSGEYLSFNLGPEQYGIDILRVQEIRSFEAPTRIANAPAYFKGVVNLRGVIVPIIDLRLKLGCRSADYNDFTVVIMLNLHDRVMGAVVDSVSDVLALTAKQIRPAPDMNDTVDLSYITGMASVAERLLILIDIEALMTSANLGLLDAQANPNWSTP